MGAAPSLAAEGGGGGGAEEAEIRGYSLGEERNPMTGVEKNFAFYITDCSALSLAVHGPVAILPTLQSPPDADRGSAINFVAKRAVNCDRLASNFDVAAAHLAALPVLFAHSTPPHSLPANSLSIFFASPSFLPCAHALTSRVPCLLSSLRAP